jgi:uridine monophosphate synthetase
MSTDGFFDLLRKRCVEADSLLCVGLDPHLARLADGKKNAQVRRVRRVRESYCKTRHDSPAVQGALEFSLSIIEQTQAVAAAYKPNVALFEAFGADGVAALRRVIQAVPAGIPVVLDSRRADVATTADAYATAAFDALGAHAVTASPYMGWDAVAPFVTGRYGRKGCFVLCKTSNESSHDLQTLRCGGGTPLFEHVATLCAEWRNGGAVGVGLVVGATDVVALARARACAPENWILAIGAQGGDLESAVRAGLFADGELGVLVAVSCGIADADDPREAAKAYRNAINVVRQRPDAVRQPPDAADVREQAVAQAFVEFAVRRGALRFGEFKLKSGRISPYFFDAGRFCTGSDLLQLGRAYAAVIASSGIEYDVLYGPAYKGIPLVAAVAMAIATHAADASHAPYAFNRKQPKDHGERGVLVGADVRGKRVLVIDDVITAGTAVAEAVATLRAAGARVVGVVVALDRQERGGGEGQTTSATEEVRNEHGVAVAAVATLAQLPAHVQQATAYEPALLGAIKRYRAAYGVRSVLDGGGADQPLLTKYGGACGRSLQVLARTHTSRLRRSRRISRL